MNDHHDYVIWSFEHDAWWRPDRWGYTPHLAAAGLYTRGEAEAIVADANIVHLHEAMFTLAEARAFRHGESGDPDPAVKPLPHSGEPDDVA